MAKSKDDIKFGAAQAKLSEDESLRVAYKHGTPLEGGKIADSEPIDLFSNARRVSESAVRQNGEEDRIEKSRPSAEEEEAAALQGDGGGI